MEDIDSLRNCLDAVDDKIISALNERFELTNRLRAIQQKLNLPSVNPAREREIFDRALAATPAAERDTIYGVYERIFSGARGVIETIARGVAIQNGQVLLCRGKGAKSTYLPGGHIEFGETGRAALVREIREELGVEASADDFLGVVENSFDQHGKRHCEINLIYKLTLKEATSQSQEDWIAFEWCPLDRLAEANLLPLDIRHYCR